MDAGVVLVRDRLTRSWPFWLPLGFWNPDANGGLGGLNTALITFWLVAQDYPLQKLGASNGEGVEALADRATGASADQTVASLAPIYRTDHPDGPPSGQACFACDGTKWMALRGGQLDCVRGQSDVTVFEALNRTAVGSSPGAGSQYTFNIYPQATFDANSTIFRIGESGNDHYVGVNRGTLQFQAGPAWSTAAGWLSKATLMRFVLNQHYLYLMDGTPTPNNPGVESNSSGGLGTTTALPDEQALEYANDGLYGCSILGWTWDQRPQIGLDGVWGETAVYAGASQELIREWGRYLIAKYGPQGEP
ncbi:MAG: hypothetical protein AAFX99_02010 [Myxococcota bacterium]